VVNYSCQTDERNISTGCYVFCNRPASYIFHATQRRENICTLHKVRDIIMAFVIAQNY